MALVLESKGASGAVLRQPVSSGRNRFRAEPGLQYRVADDLGAPMDASVTVRRIDNNLVVEGLADGRTVELEGFFRNCSEERPCSLQIDHFANAQVAEITPSSIPVGALQDGSFVMHSSSTLATVVPVAPEAESSGRGMAYVGVGLLAIGAAAGGGGGKSDPVAVSASAQGVPDTPTLTSATTTTSGTPVITGTGTPGSTITVTLDTGNNGSNELSYITLVGTDGRWTVRVGVDTPIANLLPGGVAKLPDGDTLMLIRASNAAGSSIGQVNQILQVDATAPAAPVVRAVTGDNVINAAEAAQGVTVSGTAEPGTALRLDWLGLTRNLTVDVNGNWSTSYTSSQIAAAGNARVIRATTVDTLGNSSPETTVPVTLSSIRPGVPVIQVVADDDRLNRGEAQAAAGVRVAGSALPDGVVTLTWATTPARQIRADALGNWSTTYASAELPAADGSTSLRAVVSDAGGVSGDPGTRTVFIDRLTPATPIINLIAGNDVISASEALAGVSISGTAEAGSTVTITLASASKTTQANASGAYSATFSSAELPVSGSFPVLVRASDAAGNVSADASRSVSVSTVSAATPVIGIVAGNDIVNAAEAAAGVTVSGTAEAGASVRLSWGTAVHTVTANSAGAYSSLFSAAELPADGGSAVRAVVTNLAGSSSAEVSHAVSIDRTAPVVSLATIASDGVVNYLERSAGVSVTGSSEAGSSVTVTWGSASRSVSADGNGAFSAFFDAASLPSSGSSSVSARATDAAGNAGASVSQTVTFSLTPTTYTGTGGANTLTLGETSLANLSAPGASIDGRGGIDTLSFSGAGLTLDLTQVPASAITAFERVSLTGSGNNTLRLSVTDVLDFATANVFNGSGSGGGGSWSGLPSTVAQRQLVIDGDAGDTVNATGGWTQQPGTVSNGGQTYAVYTSGTGSGAAMLLIDTDISRSLV